jgi:hypothetical protein
MADRDDLAELINPDTIALERSLGARAERGEQARAGADRILAAGRVKATAATEQCPCYDCVSPTWGQWESHMVLCPDCGNKRCPHATFHGNACTGSNDPDQSGSRYTALRALHPNQENR